ncbi:helix-turn-helix transcriptional regulator [Saccharothrix deserti]|uniref:helix-turn-helix transcriptional regulator n=1 Tax=Saccharothrix deserti TaxID=2593674 RepID=UPI00192E53C3|nr:LuxR C-terminal-related transcriptional regulator [Saccharothrix deserti]
MTGLSLLRDHGDFPAESTADVVGRFFDLHATNAGLVDAQLVLRKVGGEFATRLGVDPDNLIGRDFVDLFRGETRSTLRGQCVRLLTDGKGGFGHTAEIVDADRGPSAVRVFVIAVRSGLMVTVSPSASADSPKPILSNIDARILEAIALGQSTVHITSRLYLSRQGVDYHVGTMLRKLKAANRAALVSRAYSLGILDPGSWPPRVQPGFVKQA